LVEAQTPDINGNLIGGSIGGVIDPLLGLLANNGGPTETHALLAGSPAIDASNNGLATDQRGIARPQGIQFDIGAFELEAKTPSLVVTLATDVVDSSDNETSLREAIALANSQPGADTITFDVTLSGDTITLVGTDLEITEALTIDATPLAANVTIDADELSRIFHITATTGDFTFAGLTLTGGKTIVAGLGGGAIRSLTTGSLTLSSSTVSGNSTTGNFAYGGGIDARGDVTLTGSTVSGNSTTDDDAGGGGIFSKGDVTLTNSTVSGNSTAGYSSEGTGGGGGIFSNGAVTLTSSTVSGNSTAGSLADGGGISSYGGVTLISSTVTDNHANDSTATGGGIWNGGIDTITIANSIVAGNMAGSGSPDIRPGSGTFTVNFSLLGSAVTPGGGSGNIFSNTPLLGTLANNGGLTETHALLPSSPAIDAGSSTEPFDQRGAPFLRDDGNGVDIGAFEIQATIAPSADFDGDNDIDGADFLAWQRGFNKPSNVMKEDGDADDDGDVDGDDLGFWQAQFGGPAPAITAASTVSVLASALIDEPSPLESVAAIEAVFSEPVAPTPLPENLIDAVMATEWLSVVPEGETKEEESARVSEVEAAFAANPFAGNEADWLAPGGNTEFGATHANSEEAALEDSNSDQSWLAEELLERVFG